MPKIWSGEDDGIQKEADDPYQELFADCVSPEDALQLQQELEDFGLI